jgi:hypothetical protein
MLDCSSQRTRPTPRGGRTLVWIVALAILTIGCRKEEISIYSIPKEVPPPRQAMAGGPAAGPAVHLHWETPEGWQEQPAGGMRLANFIVPGPEGRNALVSIVTLAGVVGQDAQVVNIFRERLPAPPLAESELAAMAREIQVGPTQGRLYDMTAESENDDEGRSRLMVAVLSSGNSSWYFNFFGQNALIESEKPVFLQFLESVTIESGHDHSHHAQAAATPPPASPAGSAAYGSDAADSRLPEWTVPEGWLETPPTQMLLSRFEVHADDGQLEITVSAFPGDVGGTVANVNRWRGQIGLPPLPEAEVREALTPLDVEDGSAILIDMTNPRDTGPIRVMGVIWPRGGETWFYKLSGDEPVAEREKAAFVGFVQSVRYP